MRCYDIETILAIADAASVVGSGYGTHPLSDKKRRLGFDVYRSHRLMGGYIYIIDC